MQHRPSRIISGGQTGVDRAALDVAITLGIPHGGWCPRGRRAEDGRIHPGYNLRETAESGYQTRTIRNIMEADATLIVTLDDRPLSSGTLLTHNAARGRRRGLVRHVTVTSDPAETRAWLSAWHGPPQTKQPITIVNIAGPRESKEPGIYAATYAFLLDVFR